MTSYYFVKKNSTLLILYSCHLFVICFCFSTSLLIISILHTEMKFCMRISDIAVYLFAIGKMFDNFKFYHFQFPVCFEVFSRDLQ